MTFYSLRNAWCSYQKQFIFYSFSGAVLLCWMINWYMFILLNQVPSAVSLLCVHRRRFFSEWLIWKIELIFPSPPSPSFVSASSRLKLSPKRIFLFFILAQKSINSSPRASSSHINKTIKSNGSEAILCFVCLSLSLCKATTWRMFEDISDCEHQFSFTKMFFSEPGWGERNESITFCVYLQMFCALILMIYREEN